MNISDATKKELEFNKILQHIALFSISEKGKSYILNHPSISFEVLKIELNAVNEYLSSFENENPIVFENYENIDKELGIISIEDYVLSIESFLKIKKTCNSFFNLHKSIDKFKEYYPFLNQKIEELPIHKEILKYIDEVFTKFGEIKNTASSTLNEIRTGISLEQKRYRELFDNSFLHYRNIGFLDEIGEPVTDGMSVLAVTAMYKKRVKGTVRGMSKTGSILYMEPESTKKSWNKVIELIELQKVEIYKILKQLTKKIETYKDILHTYQTSLEEFDVIQAKAKFAQQINGILPEINDYKDIHLKDAYHPLLFITNQTEKKEIKPQDIYLSRNQRIIAISGPNAGGKSITLKTFGLLQLMIQHAILIPVHAKSKISFFDKILTDIGDNQSIENHLSTYSSRLKKMSEMFPIADQNTLLLIDEFGTGSDPELGGALAETFLEYFYEKRSFCILTTHYTNIKIIAEQLPKATNAAMLFDKNTLEPLYKLEIGQAGSSFTFEVAEKNNIPKSIINKAKEKLVTDKLNLDASIVRLQQEKFEVQKLRNTLEKKSANTDLKHQNIEDTQTQLKDKLLNLKNLYDSEQKTLNFGNKLESLISNYANGTSRKEVFKQFYKLLEEEKYKRKKKSNNKVQPKEIKKIKEKVKKEIKSKKEQFKIIEQEKIETQKINFKIGMRVKVKGSSSVATIDSIEKEKVTLNYGKFTTKISIFEIEKI